MAGADPAELGIVLYAPALAPADARPAAIVRAMERAFPGLTLSWTVGADGHLRQLADHELRAAENGMLPYACNGDVRSPVMVTGWTFHFGADSPAGSQVQVRARMPASSAGRAAAVLGAIGDVAMAYWGRVTPLGASLTIARQVGAAPLAAFPTDEPPPLGLPRLRNPVTLPPEIPHALGWLNYWSDAAARAIGFPDQARDAELLARGHRTAGGWVVPLTDAPLDLDAPGHLPALLQAYERFPAIGGRATAAG